jgi:hypothetical protein
VRTLHELKSGDALDAWLLARAASFMIVITANCKIFEVVDAFIDAFT